MEQITLKDCKDGNNGSDKNQKIKFVDSLSECFSEYFVNMFKDFGDVLEKRLERQQKKMRQNESLLRDLIDKIDSRRSESLTSLAQIQQSENNSNNTSRVKSLSINSLKEQKQLNQVNEALKKLQEGIQYLQASLTCLKSKKSIQDPQTNHSIELAQVQLTKLETKGATTAVSKIQKLASKISRFAKQSSITQIEQQKQGYVKPHRLQKSRSLITLPNRRYYPVSCPKQYEYQTKSYIHSQSQITPSMCKEYQQMQTNCSFLNENSSILLQENSKALSEENKMPLINKAKTVLIQLLSLVKDEADASVVMFYLKKGLKSVGEVVNGSKGLVRQDNCKEEIKGEKMWRKKGQNQDISQYFTNKSNTLQAHNTNDSSKNTNFTCSINQTLPNSQSGLNWIKENYSSVNGENQAQRSLHQNMHQNSHSSVNSNISRQKRKFQRTSNDQKISMLKNKFRANC